MKLESMPPSLQRKVVQHFGYRPSWDMVAGPVAAAEPGGIEFEGGRFVCGPFRSVAADVDGVQWRAIVVWQ